ncbi:MAG: uracil-DNA glycosylase [Ignavibacteria bacterium]|nr:uracil-DNA glycosylase [Ignavibacteria bacterium]
MKRNLIEDGINYLKYVRKNKGISVPSEYLKNIEIEIPDGKSGTIEMAAETHKKEYKDKLPGTNVVRDGGAVSLIKEDWMEVKNIPELDEKINKCSKCPLHSTRKNFVFGTGNPKADIMLIGEAPGAEEDNQGKPFVGRAGKLLTDILKAINLTREEVFICNILKCRPPENRNPLPEEIVRCEPYLLKQLELIKPKFILCLGTFAGQTMLRAKEPLGKMRGKFYNFNYSDLSAKLMVTYHPAALLRNPNWKRPTWEDVQLFRKEYDKEKEK